jgi:8-oxo-dGTP pyrophosphatase MutT (NUDIX family)
VSRPRTRAKRETSAGGIVVHRERRADGADDALVLLIRDSYGHWGFPKGHVERGEAPADAAMREVAEETGVSDLDLQGPLDTIDWYFRFDGQLVHKVCHFFLMETAHLETQPQVDEGISACRWERFDDAERLVSYSNARDVLRRARAMVEQPSTERS